MTTFRVSSGLPTKLHRLRMGDAIWLFLWYVDRQTGGHGWILKGRRHAKGRPVPDEEPAEALGLHSKTVGAQRRSLVVSGYILQERTGKGYRIRVLHQKKFPTIRGSSSTSRGNVNATSPEPSRGNVNATSQEGTSALHHTARGNADATSDVTPTLHPIITDTGSVQEVIYMGAHEAVTALLDDHAARWADTFGGSPPEPTTTDEELLAELLETFPTGLERQPIAQARELLARFWNKVQEVRGGDQAKFWRPTIRNFVARAPDVVMLPETTQAPNLDRLEDRGAFDMGAEAHVAGLDPGANPYEAGPLRSAWSKGWEQSDRALEDHLSRPEP